MFPSDDDKMGAISDAFKDLKPSEEEMGDELDLASLAPEELDMLKRALEAFRESDGKEPQFTGPSQDPDNVVGEDATPDAFDRSPDPEGVNGRGAVTQGGKEGEDSEDDEDDDKKKKPGAAPFGRGAVTQGG